MKNSELSNDLGFTSEEIGEHAIEFLEDKVREVCGLGESPTYSKFGAFASYEIVTSSESEDEDCVMRTPTPECRLVSIGSPFMCLGLHDHVLNCIQEAESSLSGIIFPEGYDRLSFDDVLSAQIKGMCQSFGINRMVLAVYSEDPEPVVRVGFFNFNPITITGTMMSTAHIIDERLTDVVQDRLPLNSSIEDEEEEQDEDMDDLFGDT